ncbi:MAG: KpsF/GutQ family sugar-phosphate isomerase [Planctomycetia bacterium]|nr:KpsF/GutQ family sugar-phosphate isomerase [Planctomycetia bacterium]
MSMPMRASTPPLSPLEQLRYAREIIQLEGHALATLARRLDGEFCRAVDTLYDCQGSVIASGMGKAGLIAQKVAATLASTGTRSHYLHPGEAVHGDLGRIHQDDVLVIFSQSGETEEVVRLLPSLADLGVDMIAITAGRASTLGQAASVTLELGPLQEACALGLAPSTSTTAMLAVGDALALVTSRMRDFRREDFARFHPAGSLGRQLSKVDDFMRPLVDCRLALETKSVREVFVERNRTGRRTGAIMLTDGAGKLAGLFTDSDLARLFEGRRDAALDSPIREVMTSRPATVPQGSMMVDAVAIMAERKISELPVLDSTGRPQGLIDITDVVGLFPEAGLGGAVKRIHQAGAPMIAKYPGPPRPNSPLSSPGAPPRDCA